MDTIEGMRVYAAVARTASFTVAADELGLSRALTSKYVAQLEERLGVRLLNRTTRSVEMTSAGRAYLDRALRLLEDLDDLEAAVRDRRAEPRGHLRVATPVTFAELFLPSVLAEFTTTYPKLHVTLSLSDRHVDLVGEGFDAAIRIGELAESSLVARRLASSTLTLCAAPGYLAEHEAPTHPTDIAAHRCVLDDNLRSRDHWPFSIDGRIRMIPVAGSIRVNSASIVRALLLAGQGIGLCPSFLVSGDVRDGRLIALLSDFQTPGVGIHAVYPHSRHLASGVRTFVDFLAAKLPARCP